MAERTSFRQNQTIRLRLLGAYGGSRVDSRLSNSPAVSIDPQTPLLKVIEEQAGSVKQLTYQPKLEPEPPQAANQNPPPVPSRVNWGLVLAVAAVVAVIVSGLVAVVARTTGGKLF